MSNENMTPEDDLLGEKPIPASEAIDLEEEPMVLPSEAEVLENVIQQNVYLDEPWEVKRAISEEKPFLDIPTDTSQNVIDAIKRAPNISHTSSEADRKWAEVLNSGSNLNMSDEPLLPALSRKGTEYRQCIDVNGKQLTTVINPLQPPVDTILSGKRAVIRGAHYAGLGGICTVPLWHSGFWVMFRPAMEADFVELNRMLLNDKVQLGRDTVGAIYSNMTSFMVDRVIDFAIDHIYAMSLTLKPDMSRNDIKKFILPQDIGYIVTGLMAARYTNGYQYRRSCTHNPEKCHHVVEDVLNLTKVNFIDNNALTEWQRTHMTHRGSNTVTVEDVKRYRDEFVALRDKVVKIGFSEIEDRFADVTLSVPNIAQYVEAGYRWIDGIVNTVNKGLTENISNRDKERFITQHARATKLRTYAHWITSIQFGGIQINDTETIEDMLETYSADDTFRETLIEEVKKYISETTVGLVGIPAYNCPSCKGGNEGDPTLSPNLRNIIPIDALNLFFILNIQAMERVNLRLD